MHDDQLDTLVFPLSLRRHLVLFFAFLSSATNSTRFGPVFVRGLAAASSAAATAFSRESSPKRRTTAVTALSWASTAALSGASAIVARSSLHPTP